ncbi:MULTISPECIES: cupin domain-containing protein [Nitratireductor]|uniref:Cupin 2 barrel domain-containing protein n=1 Tax=Nitratireductor pacificus pht-3B TaxID=391937 RepID=K2MMT5_9HYPH|nr:cupin domain-containing protein [Nitratireductor pacificus]EKF18557.1 cupin 2 barrel domain-containing protein [Nitratireductor pacificus pht-3B]
MNPVHSVDWSAIDWREIRSGVFQKAFSSPTATLALHRLYPEHEPRPHSHPNEQIAWIIEGFVDFHIGDVVERLGPGGIVVIPPNVMHHAIVVGDTPVLNLDVFTPSRPEYAPLPPR